MSVAERMLAAADTLEEVSALYGYLNPAFGPWTADDLRMEAGHVDLMEVEE